MSLCARSLAKETDGERRAQPQQKLRLRRVRTATAERFSTKRSNSKCAADTSAAQEEPYKWGGYTPNFGFKVANTDRGDMSISIYSYARYLNQLGLDPTYTDAFGNVKNVQQRQDFQLNKVQIKFLGWMLDPKFRYFLYAWSSNASQGLGAQVVLAGNLNYAFNKSFNIGAGIRSLPGTRSVEGNFPFWLGVDTRLIADEFFRPSYTSGVWAWGKITETAGLHRHDRQQPEHPGRKRSAAQQWLQHRVHLAGLDAYDGGIWPRLWRLRRPSKIGDPSRGPLHAE